jgi:hypothetical protein
MHRRPTTATLVAGVVALSILGGIPAVAQESSPETTAAPSSGTGGTSGGGAFSIAPAAPADAGGRDHFFFTLRPGQSYQDSVALGNYGDRPTRFAVYATDAFQTGNEAAFTLLREEEQPRDVGSWIELGATEYRLDPGEQATIPFRITVPTDAKPGDHAGGIVAQPLRPARGDPGEFNFDVRLRIAARVYVRVEGPLQPALRVNSLTFDWDNPISPLGHDDARVVYRLENTGNVRLTPAAIMKITGPLGFTVARAPERQLPELLPGTEIEVAETISAVRPAFRLTVDLSVEAPETSTRATRSMWAIPWAAIVLIVLGAIAYYIYRRRQRGAKQGAIRIAPRGSGGRTREPVGV